jgi:hypothetical protein
LLFEARPPVVLRAALMRDVRAAYLRLLLLPVPVACQCVPCTAGLSQALAEVSPEWTRGQ